MLENKSQALSYIKQMEKIMTQNGKQVSQIKSQTNAIKQIVMQNQKVLKVIGEQYNKSEKSENDETLPTIYAITPTYARIVQIPELTRLSQTFLHVNNFHWIVVEDSSKKTQQVKDLLSKCGLKYTHLNVPTPAEVKKFRGLPQRNLALEWIRINVGQQEEEQEGVIYFADDDNTYDLRLFDEVCAFNHLWFHPHKQWGNINILRALHSAIWYVYIVWTP